MYQMRSISISSLTICLNLNQFICCHKQNTNIRESQAKLEDEQRTKEVIRDSLLANERRANSAQNALEEARTLLEQSDRARRVTEQELSDTNEQLSELTCQNQAIAGAKRKLESEMETLHVSYNFHIMYS